MAMSFENRELFVNVGKFLMKNKESYRDIDVDEDFIVREFRFKDIVFSCEKTSDKIRPQFLAFDCCGEQYQLHSDGKFKKEFFDSASFEVSLNKILEDDNSEENLNEELENSFYSRIVIEDSQLIEILDSYIKWRFNILLKKKF